MRVSETSSILSFFKQPLEVKELMEDRYIHIQKAYETLKNEGKRLAYGIVRGPCLILLKSLIPTLILDKFGPESLECSHCRIEKDYLTYSLTNLIIFYSSSLTVIALLSLLGGGTRYGTYWRW